MFGVRHYVPILRWKQAEWLALAELQPEEKCVLTPLVEITPRSVAPRKRHSSLEAMLMKNAQDLSQFWGGPPVFVDLWHLDAGLRVGGGEHPISFLASAARLVGLKLIPVTGVGRDQSYQSAVRSAVAVDQRGVCVRILPSQVSSNLGQRLDGLLSQLGVDRGEVDLVVDCQITSRLHTSYQDLCAAVPNVAEWRSFVMASGAFPKDLTRLQLGSQLLPRLDWQAWRGLVSESSGIRRKPAFGDYAIQYALYEEPPDRPNFSASIRYTLADEWLVMRGEGVFHDGSPGFAQWPANAQLLCARGDFCGVGFSAGDRYIHVKSMHPNPPGNARTWLQAGLNHHMTFAARQVANLPGL